MRLDGIRLHDLGFGVYSPSAAFDADLRQANAPARSGELARASSTRAAAAATRLLRPRPFDEALSVVSPKSSHQRSPTPVVSCENPSP